MANLEVIRWEKWAPNVGRNLKLPPHERMFFKLAVGLSLNEMKAMQQALVFEPKPEESAEQAADRRRHQEAEVIGRFVKVVGEHTINGQPVASLGDYMKVVPEQVSYEVFRALIHFNTIQGAQELFSARSSGGTPTTDDPDDAE